MGMVWGGLNFSVYFICHCNHKSKCPEIDWLVCCLRSVCLVNIFPVAVIFVTTASRQ